MRKITAALITAAVTFAFAAATAAPALAADGAPKPARVAAAPSVEAARYGHLKLSMFSYSAGVDGDAVVVTAFVNSPRSRNVTFTIHVDGIPVASHVATVRAGTNLVPTFTVPVPVQIGEHSDLSVTVGR